MSKLRTRCYYCNHAKKTRGKKRIANGTFQVVDNCDNCGRNFNGPAINIPHRKVENLDALPLLEDYAAQMPPCEACGSQDGVERHHWAPVHVFGWQRAEEYPQGYLCRKCHREWHQTIVRHHGRI